MCALKTSCCLRLAFTAVSQGRREPPHTTHHLASSLLGSPKMFYPLDGKAQDTDLYGCV